MNAKPTLGPIIVTTFMVLVAGQPAVAQVEWTLEGPVVGPGDPGSWNSSRHQVGDVVFDGSTYHMYLVGGQTALSRDSPWSVGHWTWDDVTFEWVPDPANPVLEPDPGQWDGYTIYGLAVLYDGSTFRMWYSATDVQYDRINVGYATSSDGWGTWDKLAGPLVGLEPGAPDEWDDWGITPGTVLFDGSIYHMWYHALAYNSGMLTYWRIGYATSSDGLVWTKHHDPVLEATEPWEEDKVYFPEVVRIGDLYYMWYSALAKLPSPDVASIGFAVSRDGIVWEKWPDNPVAQAIPACFALDSFAAIVIDGTVHGWSAHCFEIYHLTSPNELVFFNGLEIGKTDMWNTVIP